MRVDIWSDIRCPFCYIGKRKFEAGLEMFPHKDQIEVNWHSFQLDPNLKTQTDISVYDYFVERKGVSPEQAVSMHRQVTQTAKDAGLQFNFDNTVVANSFNAHRLIQLAKTKGLGNEAEEQLFHAYFTAGKNIDDPETLVQTGVAAGMEPNEIREMLSSPAFEEEVKQDEQRAQTIGIRGVPFFVFNNQYTVSGAQAPETFTAALDQSFEEFKKENKIIISEAGDACAVDGNCN